MPKLITKYTNSANSIKCNRLNLLNLSVYAEETIGNLENGKYNPSLKLAMDIAKVFGKSVEEIFIFEEEEDDYED